MPHVHSLWRCLRQRNSEHSVPVLSIDGQVDTIALTFSYSEKANIDSSEEYDKQTYECQQNPTKVSESVPPLLFQDFFEKFILESFILLTHLKHFKLLDFKVEYF